MITYRLTCAALAAIILTTVLNAPAVSARRHWPEVKNTTEQRTRRGSRIARQARNPVPLPRPRPTEASPTPLPSPPSHDQACLDRLTAAGFEFELPVLAPASNPACVVDTPVRVKAIKSASRTRIRLAEEPVVACRFAEPLAHWLGEVVAPVFAARLGADLKAVHITGYECRNRNHAEGGKLSAHALGIAADILSFELTNGATLAIGLDGDPGDARAAIDAVRKAGCGWFTTVLGPGSDEAHANHIHVDILQHGSSNQYRICQ
jgi:hypothetical protein